MTYEEFKERTTKDASYECFEKWNKMYMAGEMDKDDFCAMVKTRVQHEAWAYLKKVYDTEIRIALASIESGDKKNFVESFDHARQVALKLFM